MTKASLLRVSTIVGFCLLVVGCRTGSEPAAEELESGPDPLGTVRDLLRAHDLLGKQPEQRTEKSKEKEVDRRALGALIVDLSDQERFLADLYVGFVVGALARNQGRLFLSRKGARAEVSAGDAKIVLVLHNGRWKIVLAESVPKEIKKRAAEEKARFDDAKKRGARAAMNN